MARAIDPNSNAQLANAAHDNGKNTFIGSPCIKCKNTLRYCSSGNACVKCRGESSKAYRANNGDKCKNLTKAWAEVNADYVKQKRLARYGLTGN
jgi:hypothetical protein